MNTSRQCRLNKAEATASLPSASFCPFETTKQSAYRRKKNIYTSARKREKKKEIAHNGWVIHSLVGGLVSGLVAEGRNSIYWGVSNVCKWRVCSTIEALNWSRVTSNVDQLLMPIAWIPSLLMSTNYFYKFLFIGYFVILSHLKAKKMVNLTGT